MLITVKRAAEILTVSPSLVYALIATGRLPAVRLGTGRGTIRLEEADVQSYLEATRVKPAVEHEFQHLRVS
ncbi:MAG: helix-turn-helix domain-containing protein [Gemmataceae bacterium]